MTLHSQRNSIVEKRKRMEIKYTLSFEIFGRLFVGNSLHLKFKNNNEISFETFIEYLSCCNHFPADSDSLKSTNAKDKLVNLHKN